MRLIDADKLKDWFFRPYSNEESYSNIEVARRIDQAPTVDRWHYPSKGEYPTENGRYLISFGGDYYEIDWWDDDDWVHNGGIIAWMPLPEPPQEEING